MDALSSPAEVAGNFGSWGTDAKICACTLRLYAQKHHGNEKPQLRSDSELVADLMVRVTGSRIPDEAPANAVSA